MRRNIKTSIKPKSKKCKHDKNSFRPYQPTFKPENWPSYSIKDKFCCVCEKAKYLTTKCFYQKTATVNAFARGFGALKFNMTEENADFRLVNSFLLINLTTQSNDQWLDSGANIHV